LRDGVSALAPGKTAVLSERGGYEAAEVLSRTDIPYSAAIAGDLEVVAVHGGSHTPPEGETGVIAIVRAAHVEVNTAYGSWMGNSAQYGPQVVPPFGGS
jgi:hypothetical protein